MFDRVRSPATGWRSPHLLLAACLILPALSAPSFAAESFEGRTVKGFCCKAWRTQRRQDQAGSKQQVWAPPAGGWRPDAVEHWQSVPKVRATCPPGLTRALIGGANPNQASA